MSLAERILWESLADERDALQGLEAGLGFPPFSTDYDRWVVVAQCKANIARTEAILTGGPAAIADWWESLPEQTREQFYNM